MQFWTKYLVSIGFSDTIVETIGYSYKANALMCFSKIATAETIENMTNLTKEELK